MISSPHSSHRVQRVPAQAVRGSPDPTSAMAEGLNRRREARAERGEDQVSRRSLILEIQELYRQGDPQPVETVLSRHPKAAKLDSLVFDLIYEEYQQRTQEGKLADPTEFSRRFVAWGIDFDQLLAAEDLLEKHHHWLKARPDVPDAEVFRDFQLVGELGRGTFAQVYLALEPALGHRPVVLKVSRNGAAEANTLGRLDHPNIVPVYSVHHDPTSGMTAVCMPYLGSATLENVRTALLLHEGSRPSAQMIWDSIQDPLAPEFHSAERRSAPAWLSRGSYGTAILHLGHQLARALAFVHEQGFFHRDLKPSNVLMTPDGRPMLLDFNLSRHKHLADDQIAGTIVYMPPEQLAAVHPGERSIAPTLIDERSDLFSLGVILYELLTGVYPFGPPPQHMNPKEQAADWFEKQKAGFVPLREKNPHVDAATARVIERCLAFDPKARPANARELAAELDRLVSRAGRARRWVSMHVPLLLFSTVMAMAGVAVVTYALIPKEPYSARQFHKGWDAYHQARYEEAIEYLDRAVDADRLNIDVRMARGRAFLQLGRYESALADFQAADKLAEGTDGRIKACLGYCSNLMGSPEVAIVHYDQARSLNFVTAGLLNNLGFSYIQWKNPQRPKDSLDRADWFLTEALKLDDSLQAAYYNRAEVDLLRAGLNRGSAPRQGLADIHRAIDLGPVSTSLYLEAARLSYLVANRDRGDDTETFEYLRKAVDNGLDPAKLQTDFMFQNLAADPRFLAILGKKHDSKLFKEAPRLVNPIDD